MCNGRWAQSNYRRSCPHIVAPTYYTVKRSIIGEDLFGEIGEIINFAQISSHQLKKYGPQPISFNAIAKLNVGHIVIFSKPPNIISTNISCFTIYQNTIIMSLQ